MPIRRLSVQLANQIAAGEVVERPASVVKELLENAVDAKADRITLEIRGAGKVLIRVTDNGCGIPEEELSLALAPHATSKISCQEDLEAIRTLGFRGEALASIASVSKLTLTSRTADQDCAFSAEAFGQMQQCEILPAAHPVGTTVSVAELFFNTPARRRFLKSDKTEISHIKEVFTCIALVNFNRTFTFIADGREVFRLPAVKDDDIARRIEVLLGNDFKSGGMYFDSEKRRKASSDHTGTDILTLRGVLMPPPSMTQSIPDRLYTFLNGRVISDRTVNHAVREAYLDPLMSRGDKFRPAIRGVIFAECDPRIVDVNVHPRKDEVRFHDAGAVHECIKREISSLMRDYALNKSTVSQGTLQSGMLQRSDAGRSSPVQTLSQSERAEKLFRTRTVADKDVTFSKAETEQREKITEYMRQTAAEFLTSEDIGSGAHLSGALVLPAYLKSREEDEDALREIADLYGSFGEEKKKSYSDTVGLSLGDVHSLLNTQVKGQTAPLPFEKREDEPLLANIHAADSDFEPEAPIIGSAAEDYSILRQSAVESFRNIYDPEFFTAQNDFTCKNEGKAEQTDSATASDRDNEEYCIEILSSVKGDIVLFKAGSKFFMGSASSVAAGAAALQWTGEVISGSVDSVSPSSAFAVQSDRILCNALKKEEVRKAVLCCGFDLRAAGSNIIQVHKFPAVFKGCNFADKLPSVLAVIAASQSALNAGSVPDALIHEMKRVLSAEYKLKGVSHISALSKGYFKNLCRLSDIRELNLLEIADSIKD